MINETFVCLQIYRSQSDEVIFYFLSSVSKDLFICLFILYYNLTPHFPTQIHHSWSSSENMKHFLTFFGHVYVCVWNKEIYCNKIRGNMSDHFYIVRYCDVSDDIKVVPVFESDQERRRRRRKKDRDNLTMKTHFSVSFLLQLCMINFIVSPAD